MAKSKIIKELANKEVSLEVAFNRLLIIASDLNNDDLVNWATNELNGYSKDSKIPKYREGKMGHIVYSGINGRIQVNNQPLPLSIFDKELLDYIRINYFDQDIATIEQFAFGDNGNIGLDDLDIDTNVKNLKEINNKLNIIIFEDNSVTIGDGNKLKNNLFQK